jgi:hypothetical protein
MPKKEKRGPAVGKFLGELAAEYVRLPAAESREKLRSGAALVASRKELRAKRRLFSSFGSNRVTR